MPRRAADLDTLVRLRKWIVDERRRELDALLAREEQLVLHGKELEKQIVREGAIAVADPTRAGFTFGPFAANHRRQRERLASVLADVRREIESARETLSEAFRDRKVLEEAQRVRAQRERAEENRVEQIALDEIAQNQHQRRV